MLAGSGWQHETLHTDVAAPRSHPALGPCAFNSSRCRAPSSRSTDAQGITPTVTHSTDVVDVLRALKAQTRPEGAIERPDTFLHRALEVNLAGRRLGRPGLESLAPCLLHLPALQRLDLSANALCSVSIQLLCATLPVLPALRFLDLGSNAICAIGARALAPQLTAVTNLRELRLQHNQLGTEGVLALAPALSVLQRLRRLNLSGNRIRATGAQALADHLDGLSSLQSLILNANALGPSGVEVLGPVLARMKQMREVCINDNKAGRAVGGLAGHLSDAVEAFWSNSNGDGSPAGALQIARVLPRMRALRVLSLNAASIGPEGAWAFTCLGALTSLQEIYIAGNDLRPEGIKALASTIASLPSVVGLDLSSNALGVEGATILGPHLARMTQLKSLALNANGLGPPGMRVLVPFLEALTLLQRLRVNDNAIGVEGADALAACLGGMTGLQEFHANGNGLAVGVRVIAQRLARARALHTVFLSDNELGDGGARVLAANVPSMTALRCLCLRSNMIGEMGTRELQACARGARVKILTGRESSTLARGSTTGRGSTVRRQDTTSSRSSVSTSTAMSAEVHPVSTSVHEASIPSTGCDAKADNEGVLTENALKAFQELRVPLLSGQTDVQLLTAVNLDGRALGSNGAQTLACHIPALRALNALSLEGTDIGNEGARWITAALGGMTHVTMLNLCNNAIDGTGAAPLAQTLSELTSLQHLALNRNSLGSEGVSALLPGLAKLVNLNTLLLSCVGMKDAAAEELATCLRHWPRLEELYLSGNSIGGAAQAVGRDLAGLSRISMLSLSDIQLSGSQARWLAVELQRVTSLRIVWLSNEGIQRADAAYVRHKLELVKSVFL